MYNSEHALQSQWQSAHRWIQNCRPHNSCQQGYFRNYCTHDFCTRHGQYQRIEKANKVLALGNPDVDAFAVVPHYGTALVPHRIAQARSHFLKKLSRTYPEIGVLWRLHFVDYIPHLNLTLLVKYNCSNMVSKVKQIWTDSLSLIGHDKPTSEDVYFKPVETYQAWIKYLFQTNRVLTIKECPPKIPHSRWSFWGMNKSYVKLLKLRS